VRRLRRRRADTNFAPATLFLGPLEGAVPIKKRHVTRLQKATGRLVPENVI
jgi:hypothetical protein